MPILRESFMVIAFKMIACVQLKYHQLDCANFELTNHIAYSVENKSLISTAGEHFF